jgi:hypothetical protein
MILDGAATLGSIGGESVGIIIFGGGFVVAIVAILTGALQNMARTRAREESRREIAAYVAEGSISADDAARLIAAGESLKDKVGLKF